MSTQGPRALCGVCQRKVPHRRDAFGYVIAADSDEDDWSLYLHSKRLGSRDAAIGYNSVWGRMKAPNLRARGRKRSDGSLRSPSSEPIRIECPAGHRLNPSGAVLDGAIVDSIRGRSPYVVIPER